MATPDRSPNDDAIEARIQRIGSYSRFVRAGLGVILAAFVLAAVAVLPANLDTAADAVETMLLPTIFVGMGLLLYGIGMHLHLMHLNLVRQLRMGDEPGADGGGDTGDGG